MLRKEAASLEFLWREPAASQRAAPRAELSLLAFRATTVGTNHHLGLNESHCAKFVTHVRWLEIARV